jgi:hypothetical protein
MSGECQTTNRGDYDEVSIVATRKRDRKIGKSFFSFNPVTIFVVCACIFRKRKMTPLPHLTRAILPF